MKHHLSIDLETFSSVPIGKAGAYKYVQSPDFEILLFAYSLNDSPVVVVDLAQGEVLPDWLYKAIESPEYIKHAYNAAFEWYCLSKFCGRLLPVDQWRDTMLHGLYCGFTAGLDATGKALGLPAEKQKLSVGKALIRYFCVPCTPTQSNGGRHRNLPKHDPDKWDLFKTYCLGDVTTEKEIERRLSAFPVPDDIEKQWQTDLLINARGVAVDMGMVRGALAIGASSRDKLMQEAVAITGLENPNSIAQLSQWLEKATDTPVTDLRKDTVATMLESQAVTGSAGRMLEIRQELGKTSTKKYDAIEAAVCADGRVRGLLQFYGANRTGRWCLTGDHEILTPTGWARLDEWDGGAIACWQPNGEMISFQKAERVCFDYDGPMYEYNDKRISQVSTPDHKMYVKRVYSGEWIADTVENMQAYRPSIPFTGWRRTTPGQEHEKLRVLVMVQADGHYTENGSVRFAFKKERKIERCKMLLRRAGISFTERGYSDRTVIEIPSRTVPLWLRQFKDKTFGPWLFDESPDVFFEELVYWDGYRSAKNSIQYSTCNKVNADLVQAFAHMSGRAALIKVKYRSAEHENWGDAYAVDIWQNPGNRHEIRSKAAIYNCRCKVYCAVTQTGYFLVRRNGRVWVTGNSGRLVQVQNLPRTYIAAEHLPLAREAVRNKQEDKLRLLYGSVPDTLSQLIRTSFVASEGNKLVDADFSAIEARVISWLAGEQWRLEVFRTHGKIYEASASQMFGVPLEKIKKGNPEYALRQKGKVAELALGYQGSSGALIAMGALKMGIPEDDLPDIVSRWRDSNKRIVDLWYSLESAAVSVIQTGHPAGVRGLMLAREMDIENGLDFLTITLPSRRKLYYAKPSLGENSWGRPSILYCGVNQTTKQWTQLETYGGKLVENCLSGDTLVLTPGGWKRLDAITVDDEVWDGQQWVSHDGLIVRGEQIVIEVDGVHMTPDHKIFTESGWQCASSSERYYRHEVELPDGHSQCRFRRKEVVVNDPLRLWERVRDARVRISERAAEIVRVYAPKADRRRAGNSPAFLAPHVPCLAVNGGTLPLADSSGVGELRRAWHQGVRPLVGELREFLERYVSELSPRSVAGQNRRERGLLPGELPVGDGQDADAEQAQHPSCGHPAGKNVAFRSIREIWHRKDHAALPGGPRRTGRYAVHETGRYESVYDLRNCGPNHCFTVMSKAGPMLVHNCVQAIARDCLAIAIERLEAAGFPVVFHIHDEVVVDCPAEKADLGEVVRLMSLPIPWAPDLPLNADGWVGDFFRKD